MLHSVRARGHHLLIAALLCAPCACSGTTQDKGLSGDGWGSYGNGPWSDGGSSSGSGSGSSSGAPARPTGSSSGGTGTSSTSGSGGGSRSGSDAGDAGEAGDAGGSGGAGKKGVGLSRFSEAQLQALGVAWYYDWGATSAPRPGVDFVPMIFTLGSLGQTITGPIVLGFNEPDLAAQANLTVANALSAWPQVVAKAPFVVAPAVAGNPVTGTWFPAFMQARPKVDAVALHWYKGATSATFISDVKALIAAYNLPVWVTEFAPQTISESQADPTKFSQAQVDQFIADTVSWMEAEPMVARYAWHDSRTGTSALFDAAGAVTPTGTSYAAAR